MLRKPVRNSGWHHVNWADLSRHGYLNCPQLEPTNLSPQVYDILVGPDSIKKGISLLTYEHKVNNPRHRFNNWVQYVNCIQQDPLQKMVYFKRFEDQPDRWRDDLFGSFQPCTVIKCLVPPTMKSAGDRAKANWHVAGIAVASSIPDISRLGLKDDLSRILGVFCDCKYKNGLMGACPHVAAVFLGLCCSNSGLLRCSETEPVRLLTGTDDNLNPYSIHPEICRQNKQTRQYTVASNVSNTRANDPRYKRYLGSSLIATSRSSYTTSDMQESERLFCEDTSHLSSSTQATDSLDQRSSIAGLAFTTTNISNDVNDYMLTSSEATEEIVERDGIQVLADSPYTGTETETETASDNTLVQNHSPPSQSDLKILQYLSQFTTSNNACTQPPKLKQIPDRIKFNGITNETGVLCPLICIVYMFHGQELSKELWSYPYANRMTQIVNYYLSNMPSSAQFSVLPIAR